MAGANRLGAPQPTIKLESYPQSQPDGAAAVPSLLRGALEEAAKVRITGDTRLGDGENFACFVHETKASARKYSQIARHSKLIVGVKTTAKERE